MATEPKVYQTITITEGGMVDRKDFTDGQADAIRNLYRSVIASEARSVCEGIADDLEARIKEDKDFDRDNLVDALSEACDGALVYTADIAEYLQASDHENAYEEEIGEPAPDDGAKACMALQADVREEMERRGYDMNDDSEWPGRTVEESTEANA